MVESTKEIDKALVVICEGITDCSFLQQLQSRRALPVFNCKFGTKEGGITPGIDGLGEVFRSLLPTKGFEQNAKHVLIVADCDDDPGVNFTTVQSQIKKVIEDEGTSDRFSVPHLPFEVTDSQVSIQIVTLPGRDKTGTLESLIISVLKDTTPELYACVESFSNCSGAAEWTRAKREKMIVEAFLAGYCRKRPAVPFYQAWPYIEKVVPMEHVLFDEISLVLDAYR